MNVSGPVFLAIYAGLAGVVVLANRFLRNQREGGHGQEPPRLTDAYQIACLRGGKMEVARLAIVNLIRSGLLESNGNTITSATRGLPGHILETAERVVLDIGRQGATKATEAVQRAARAEEMKRYEEPLAAMGLIPGPALRAQRVNWMAVWLVLLCSVAGLRIYQALERGRHNVGFLVVLVAASIGILIAQTMKKRTTFGDRTLAGLRELFNKTAVAQASIEPREAAMVAAVWGVGALMANNDFLFVPSLFPKASSKGDCGSSCGSSCGSDSGSSDGGSSCGGGGCGGCGGE
ncbi:MAG: TIGR04222 domain-containing membrane protein [Bryobacteraceae bacterium]